MDRLNVLLDIQENHLLEFKWVSECLLLYTKWAIFQLYHCKNKLLAHWNSSLHIDIFPHSNTISWFRQTSFSFYSICNVINREATNTNFKNPKLLHTCPLVRLPVHVNLYTVYILLQQNNYDKNEGTSLNLPCVISIWKFVMDDTEMHTKKTRL